MSDGLKRVLITGGAGFIGTHLAERLRDSYELVLYDNFHRNSLSSLPELHSDPRVRVVLGEILDRESLKTAMKDVDTVIHLAAIAGVSSYYSEPLKTLQVNIEGTINVLQQAATAGVGSFVYFSTSEVFGRRALWVDEDSPFEIGPVSDPRWTYATSKLAGEQLSLRYADEHGFACTIVRPFNIYGPRQVGEGAVRNFCAAAANGHSMRIYGDGSSIRAWCYVSDLVDAVTVLLSKPEVAGNAFNIGNPKAVETTIGLAQRIARLAPSTTIAFSPKNHTEIEARIPKITKAQAMLGFEPKVGLDEGLSLTLGWYKKINQ
jgi:nucleoside-diphosphate-sugar epimerase